jgi:hypothetical protein
MVSVPPFYIEKSSGTAIAYFVKLALLRLSIREDNLR